MSLEIQISSSLLLTSANKGQTFFTSQALFRVFLFSEIMLESWGCGLYTSAAYTRVFTVFSISLANDRLMDFTQLSKAYSASKTRANMYLWSGT